MNRVFIDTNVVLDIVLSREGYFHASAACISSLKASKVTMFVSPMALVHIYYHARKWSSPMEAKSKIQALLREFQVSPAVENVVQLALGFELTDLEDAVQCAYALQAQCECIVTRNTKDFKRGPLPCLTPMEMKAQLEVL